MIWTLWAVAAIAPIVRSVLAIIAAVLVAGILIDNFAIARQFHPVLTTSIGQARTIVMDRLGEGVGRYVPTRFGGRDRTDWVLLVLAFLMSGAVGRIADGARRQMFRREMDAKVSALFADTGLKEGSRVTRELEEKVKALKAGGKVDRKELLKIFAETKRKLEGMGRELAFLSIDVVGSTAMKAREDAPTAQIDFTEYRKMVEGVLNANGLIKAAWTPDGVMACFSHIDIAVTAGQAVIHGLDRFNREVRLMKTPFVVRCGVNSGFVYLDDEIPLEQVSDRVIDIAGHMQKYAEPNTVAVPKSVIKPLNADAGFERTDKVVDGLEVYSWKP